MKTKTYRELGYLTIEHLLHETIRGLGENNLKETDRVAREYISRKSGSAPYGTSCQHGYETGR